MQILNSILATVRFEISRVMTMQRLSVAVIMALFPPAMIYILESTGALLAPEFIISLLCGMICLLSLLLWSTSNVYTELEGKSWTFVTSRPYGRWSILFGKYLIGFFLSFLIAWVSLTLAMFAASDAPFLTDPADPDAISSDWNARDQMPPPPSAPMPEGGEVNGSEISRGEQAVPEPPMLPESRPNGQEETRNGVFQQLENTGEGTTRFMIWVYFSTLLFLASMVYSAIFSFLGVVIQRRAMAVAVGYFGIVEIVFAGIPAVIGQLAMSRHMVGLLINWMGWIGTSTSDQNEFMRIYSPQETWVHLAAIFAMTLLMLGLSAFVIRIREYITLEDSQV